MLFQDYENQKLASSLKLGGSKGKTLALCYDLGNDSLKISYAFKEAFGRITFGKIIEDNVIKSSTIASDAYYDTADDMWYFGKQIEYLPDADFLYTVNIKDLLLLLRKTGDKNIDESNSSYYYKGNEFPKYYFPNKVEKVSEYKIKIDRDYTFKVNKCTPQMVCEKYFLFVSSIVYKTLPRIEAKHGISIKDIKLSICYPSNVGKAYLEELTTLINNSFSNINCMVERTVSSTKALTYYAEYLNKISDDDHFLVFDIGDETISVSKATFIAGSSDKGGKVLIDGKYGHKEPEAIGGNYIDEAIAKVIENDLSKSETMGSESYGSSGHISEEGLYSKQLLMLKNIKKAKLVLSCGLSSKPMFSKGVPISIIKHSIIQRLLTKDDLEKCIGVKGDSTQSIASKIRDYIISEASTINNEDVNKIFLAGGTIETLGLLKYLQEEVKKVFKNKKIEVLTFETEHNSDDNYLGITEYEDSVYSPAMGGNYIVLDDIQIKTCIYYSYATYGYYKGVPSQTTKKKVLKVFADKGSELKQNDITVFSEKFDIMESTNDEMYSVSYSLKDFSRKRSEANLFYCTVDKKNSIVIGDKGDEYRRKSEAFADLKVIGTGRLRLTYMGTEIKIISDNIANGIQIEEGIELNSEGLAKAFVKNIEDKVHPNRQVRINFKNTEKVVKARDIMVSFEGFPDIDVTNSDEI